MLDIFPRSKLSAIGAETTISPFDFKYMDIENYIDSGNENQANPWPVLVYLHQFSQYTHTTSVIFQDGHCTKKVLESVGPKRLNLKVDGKLTILRNFWQKHWPQKIDNQCVDNQKRPKTLM